MIFYQHRWERVFNLGLGTSFFLFGGYSAAFSVVEQGISIRGNSIYFAHDADDATLYSFCLADKSLAFWRNHSNPGSLCVSLDEMMPSLRFSKKPKSCPTKTIKGRDPGIENTSESIVFQLPEGLHMLIFPHIPTLVGQMNFRAACKDWRSLIHPMQWKVNEVPYKYPWLMFPQGDYMGVMYNLFDPITNLMHVINVPQLEGCRVRFSNRGWLLVTKAPSSIFFFEPFSRRKIQLPNLMPLEDIDAFCFSGAPTSPNRQILATRHVLEVIDAFYLRRGDEQWSGLNLTISPENCFTNMVFDGDSFCYLGKDGSLTCFKFGDDDGRLIDWHVGCSASHLTNLWRRFLTCYDNELILVYFDHVRCI